MFKNIKAADWGIVTAALSLLIASFVFAYSSGDESAELNIKNEKNIWVYPLDAADTISIPGPLGETIVEIGEGRAQIIFSPCKNQSCVTMGQVYLPGQWSACLPNKVLLYVNESENTNRNKVDATTW